jgi:chromosome segregation ATPase
MPRVNLKTKNKGGKEGTYRCGRCSDPIKPGEKYYEWSFRYGGTHRQHESHGRPKNSQLTQSKMSGVYAAIESCEDALGSAETKEDIESAVEDCVSEIESVRDEYQESLDNMPDGLRDANTEIPDKIEALESFASELGDAKDSLEGDIEEEPEEPTQNEGESDADFAARHKEWEEPHEQWEEERDAKIQEWSDAINDALGNLSI